MVDSPVEDTVVLIVYAHNRPGVLAKIAGAFDRRGMNICALSARPTREPELSKILVRVVAPRAQIERVAAALRNLIDVLSVALSNPPAHPLGVVETGQHADAVTGEESVV